MFEFVKNIFRKRSLKKHASDVPTGILPLSQIKSYVAIIDVEDTSYDTCKSSILNYFRSMDIRGSVFFQDFRKIGSEDRLITSIQTTITKKDLDWLGRPNKYKLGVLEEQNPDLFISLIKDPEFAIEYMTKTSKAKFKIGRKQLPGDTFDMIFTDNPDKPSSQDEVFRKMEQILLKIQ